MLLVLPIERVLYAQSELPSVEFNYNNGLVNLNAQNSTLADVLNVIEENTTIDTHLLVAAEGLPKFNLKLNDLSFAEFVEHLLKDMNHMIVYEAEKKEHDGNHKLPEQIWVLDKKGNPHITNIAEQSAFQELNDKQRSEMLLHFVNETSLPQSQLVKTLSTSLGTDRNALVRTRAAIGLAKLNSKESVPALINALSDESQSVRSQVILALGQLGTHDSINALGSILNENTNSLERSMAVRALREIDSDAAKQYLDLAGNDLNSQVRESIVPDAVPSDRKSNLFNSQ